jgi:predicted site-specific integrase-resolvase
MITPDAAAAIAALTVRTVYRWVEMGDIHFIEEPNGLLVCLGSLLERNVRELSTALESSP